MCSLGRRLLCCCRRKEVCPPELNFSSTIRSTLHAAHRTSEARGIARKSNADLCSRRQERKQKFCPFVATATRLSHTHAAAAQTSIICPAYRSSCTAKMSRLFRVFFCCPPFYCALLRSCPALVAHIFAATAYEELPRAPVLIARAARPGRHAKAALHRIRRPCTSAFHA